MLNLVEVTAKNKSEIGDFLNLAGESLKTFRYFNSRELGVISHHLITYLLKVNNRAIAYGHLDKEKDVIWLGIAVAEGEKGKGYGRLLMQRLIEKARDLKLQRIRLSVDQENAPAINLYKKFGFNQFKQQGSTLYFELHL